MHVGDHREHPVSSNKTLDDMDGMDGMSKIYGANHELKL